MKLLKHLHHFPPNYRPTKLPERQRKTIRPWRLISPQIWESFGNLLIRKLPLQNLIIQGVKSFKKTWLHIRSSHLRFLKQGFKEGTNTFFKLLLFIQPNTLNCHATDKISLSLSISHTVKELGIVVSLLQPKSPRLLPLRNFFKDGTMTKFISGYPLTTPIFLRKRTKPF